MAINTSKGVDWNPIGLGNFSTQFFETITSTAFIVLLRIRSPIMTTRAVPYRFTTRSTQSPTAHPVAIHDDFVYAFGTPVRFFFGEAAVTTFMTVQVDTSTCTITAIALVTIFDVTNIRGPSGFVTSVPTIAT